MSEEAKREEAEAKPQPMDSETSYINQPVTARELRDLAKLAAVEEKAFFVRNPHLSKPYQQRLLLVALCQGAVLQYLGCGRGVKDFDVHFFYAQNPEKKKLSRPTKEVYACIGAFPVLPIQFMRAVMPETQPCLEAEAAIQAVREFLRNKPTTGAYYLSKKAVIGLYPTEMFGIEIWRSPTLDYDD